MIQANELRIGNLILDRGEKVLRVDWFEREKICMKMVIRGTEVHPLTEEVKHLHPIPLTEEMLLKCGFKKSPVFGAYYIDVDDELQIYVGTTKRISLINQLDEDEHYSIIQVDSLHQLQNLYFALTGEELNVSGVLTNK